MKYVAIVAVILLLVGCKMPGVGELEERVDDLETESSYDDTELVDRIVDVEYDLAELNDKMEDMELSGPSVQTVGEQSGQQVNTQPTELQVPDFDEIPGLQEALAEMQSSISDTISRVGSSVEELNENITNLTTENDSLRVELEDLKETVEDLRSTVNNMGSSGGGGSSGGSHSGDAGVRN